VSVPARQVTLRAPFPGVVPERHPVPERTPAPRDRPSSVPRSRVRSRRRLHVGFLVFTGVVVTVLIVGVVALNAFLAQAAFQIRSAETRLEELRRDQLQLTDEAARQSSPVLVAAWARQHDMVTPAPGEVHILRVPGSGR
jgi:cell division protein FtsB